MTTRLTLAAVLIALTAATAARAGDADWLTDYDAALAESARTGKPVLVDFTGSDWCGWCKKLKREVFDTDAFAKWAGENVVLLEIDMPRNKPQSDELKAQNRRLVNEYGVRGFPTILVLDQTGQVLGRTGYVQGGPTKWIPNAQSIVDKAKPQPATIEPSLTDAISKAKADGRAVVVIYEPTADAKAADAVGELLLDAGVKKLADGRLAIAHVVADGDGAAPAEQLAALAKLAERASAKLDGAQVWVVDPTGEAPKTIATFAGVPGAADLLKALKGKLPTPKYDGAWLADYARAQVIARATGKPILLSFVGSDWSKWSQSLEKDIYGSDAFRKYARENLVLMRVDFPKQGGQTPAVQAQNRKLLMDHNVQGFPMVFVIDSAMRRLGQVEYGDGGPDEYVKNIQRVIGSARQTISN